VVSKIKTGTNPDSIIYEPVTKHIFTFNGDSHNTTIIDAVKESVITTLDLIGKVEFPALGCRMRQKLDIVRRNGKQQGGPMALDNIEHGLRFRRAGQQNARGAHGQGKVKSVSETIREE